MAGAFSLIDLTLGVGKKKGRKKERTLQDPSFLFFC